MSETVPPVSRGYMRGVIAACLADYRALLLAMNPDEHMDHRAALEMQEDGARYLAKICAHDSARIDWLADAAKYAVLISGSECEGFYVSVGTACTHEQHRDLRGAIDRLRGK